MQFHRSRFLNQSYFTYHILAHECVYSSLHTYIQWYFMYVYDWDVNRYDYAFRYTLWIQKYMYCYCIIVKAFTLKRLKSAVSKSCLSLQFINVNNISFWLLIIVWSVSLLKSYESMIICIKFIHHVRVKRFYFISYRLFYLTYHFNYFKIIWVQCTSSKE